MNILASLLGPSDILLDLEVLSKKRVFEEVGRLFDGRDGLSKAYVEQSLGEREDLGSTGLGHGVAIPHARIKSLQRPIGAFVRTRLPIPFDAPDEKPVSDMFVLLVPEKATEAHLQILAAIAQKFSSRVFRDKLRSCGTAVEVCELFSDSGDSETAAGE